MVLYVKQIKLRSIVMEKNLKIVIADDSTEFSKNCAKILKSYGMQVVLTEKDGLKALRRRCCHRCDRISQASRRLAFFGLERADARR